MKAWRNIGLAVVILFVLTAVPVMAEANIIEQRALKWDFPPEGEDPWLVYNECSGEDVSVWGTFHDQWLVVDDGTGVTHWVNHWRAQGHGEGVISGDKYIYKGGDVREVENPDGGSHVYREDGTYASTGTKYMDLIGTGGAASYRMRCISHTTINANGDMVTEFESCWISCD